MTEAEKNFRKARFIRGAWNLIHDLAVNYLKELYEIEAELEVYTFCEMLDYVIPSYELGGDPVVQDLYDFIFDPENWVGSDKAVGAGTWIRVETATGFQLHFAKRTRALPRNAIKNALQTFIGQQKKPELELLSADDKQELENLRAKKEGRKAETFEPFENAIEQFARISGELDQSRYEVIRGYIQKVYDTTPYRLKFATIRTSKRKSSYLLPSQYSKATDGILSLFDHVGRTNALKFKRYFEMVGQEAQIFYLQTRGYKRQQAEVAVGKQAGYLDVNLDLIYAT